MTSLPRELVSAIGEAYGPAGISVSSPAEYEAEGRNYAACRLGLNGQAVAFRVAKTTPTKVGQFVTLWKRSAPGEPIAPLDVRDGVAFVVVDVSDSTHRGQFIFDQALLIAKGVVSVGGRGGKRAIRVYPPWIRPVAPDAVRTQRWQMPRFLPLASNGTADAAVVRRLLGATDPQC